MINKLNHSYYISNNNIYEDWVDNLINSHKEKLDQIKSSRLYDARRDIYTPRIEKSNKNKI